MVNLPLATIDSMGPTIYTVAGTAQMTAYVACHRRSLRALFRWRCLGSNDLESSPHDSRRGSPQTDHVNPFDQRTSVPQIIRRGISGDFAFRSGMHIDAVDTLVVGGISETDFKFVCVLFRLTYAQRQRFIPSFRFDHSKLGIAILKYIVSRQRFSASAVAFQASWRDAVFTTNAATRHHTPTPQSQDQYDRYEFQLRSC